MSTDKSNQGFVNNSNQGFVNDRPQKKALNPTVFKLGMVSLFADISSEMLYPITPIFLTTVLGASMTSVGLIEGIAEGTASLLKVFSGSWSDRLKKRKIFIGVGYLLSAIAKPVIGFATAWPQVLTARTLDRFGKGIRSSPRDALLADAVPKELRGEAYGWHRGMDTLGAALGPLIALAYLHFYSDLRPIFSWALIPGLISVFFVLSLKEPVAKETIKKKVELKLSVFSSSFKRYLFAWTCFSLTNSSDVFLLLKVQKSGYSLTTTLFLYVFYNLLYAVSSPYLGKLSDHWGRKKTLIAGLLVFAAVYLLFGFAYAEWQYWILFGVYGIYMGATDGVGKALAVDLIDPQLKATGLGVLGAFTGFATIAASALAGVLWDHAGAQATFIYGAMGALIAIILLATLKIPRTA